MAICSLSCVAQQLDNNSRPTDTTSSSPLSTGDAFTPFCLFTCAEQTTFNLSRLCACVACGDGDSDSADLTARRRGDERRTRAHSESEPRRGVAKHGMARFFGRLARPVCSLVAPSLYSYIKIVNKRRRRFGVGDSAALSSSRRRDEIKRQTGKKKEQLGSVRFDPLT